MEPHIWSEILTAGIGAPSADNSQPWKYARHDSHCELWIDQNRAGGYSDARFVLSDLALGATLESMLQCASLHQYRAEIEYYPDGASLLYAARIRWVHEPRMNPLPQATALSRRYTDRRLRFRGPVSAQTQEALAKAACAAAGETALVFPTGAARGTALQILTDAETLRFKYEPLHQELFGSIRWEAGWRRGCDEGLSPATLAIEPPARGPFRMLRSWSIMRRLQALGVPRLLGLRAAYLPARLAPALGLLATRDTSRTGVVRAGQALQRVWLEAAKEGVAVQPYAAAGIYALGHIELGPRFDAESARLRNALTTLTPPGYQGLIFLRLGRTSGTPPRSGRREAESFTL